MQSFCQSQFTFNNFKTYFHFLEKECNFVKRVCWDAVIPKLPCTEDISLWAFY